MSENRNTDDLLLQNEQQQSKINRLNAELRREVAEYDMLMESTGVCIVKIRMEAGFPVLWCNEAAYQTIGYTKEEYEAQFGYDLRPFFHGREAALDALCNAMNTALASGKLRFRAFVNLPRRDGTLWAQCSGTFTDYDSSTGRPTAVYGAFTDVTAVVETQEKLAAADRENARLADVLDNIPGGVCVSDIKNGRPVSITINRHLAQHLGIASGIYKIHSNDQLADHVHAEDRSAYREALRVFLQETGRLDLICRLRKGDPGDFFWARIEGRLTDTGTDSATAYLTFTDIGPLKETERMLQEAVVSADLLVWEYDIPNHTIHLADNEVTAEYCRKFGFGHVISNVPEALAEYVTEESMPVLREMYQKVESGKNASFELWYKRTPRWEPHCERVNYTVECDERGNAVRAYAVGLNITAEKNIEERYAREQSYLRENRNFNLIAKGHYNLTQNRILEYTMQNQKTPDADYFSADTRLTYDEGLADFLKMPCPEEDRAMLAEALNRETLLRLYHEGHTVSTVQYRRMMPGGLPLWISLETRVYVMPLTGDMECFSYSYDITDRMRNEEIMNGIAATEFDYVGLIYANSGMFEFLQKSSSIQFPKAHVKTPYSECCDYVRSSFVTPEEREQFDASVCLEGILRHLEISDRWSASYRRREGEKIYFKQVDYSWLNRQERIILSVRTDISASHERDQRQLSEMRAAKLEADQANEAKSAFLSSMSHDMRTPLNAVLGFTDLALREGNTEKKQQYLQKVKSSGALLLDLVNDTLELSRIESGKLVLEPEAVSGTEIWDSVGTSLQAAAAEKNIKLLADRPTVINRTIWADRLKLQKVLLNLISNAIKYTPAGGTVHVAIDEIDPPVSGRTHRITVEDNGIGISADFLPKVFEPFAQEHRAEAGKVAGTGLGLAIVKRIVDLMGGTIRVQSKMNCGTRFTVELPIQTLQSEAAGRQEKPKEMISLAGKMALLCEDNDLNAEIVTILLNEKGMDVERAGNGQEGVSKFANSMAGYYDVVLMDIRMPVLDGYDATKKIRGLSRPDAKTVPILAMTADAFESEIRHAREVGMNDYITKPVDPQKLFRAISEQLDAGRSK